jgi:hypothetical protein
MPDLTPKRPRLSRPARLSPAQAFAYAAVTVSDEDARMSIDYHDPRATRLAPPEPYRLAAALDGEVTLGLLANGFPDSAAFLDAVESVLAARLPSARFKRYDKGNPSVPANAALLDLIAGECTAVASAYGH